MEDPGETGSGGERESPMVKLKFDDWYNDHLVSCFIFYFLLYFCFNVQAAAPVQQGSSWKDKHSEVEL